MIAELTGRLPDLRKVFVTASCFIHLLPSVLGLVNPVLQSPQQEPLPPREPKTPLRDPQSVPSYSNQAGKVPWLDQDNEGPFEGLPAKPQNIVPAEPKLSGDGDNLTFVQQVQETLSDAFKSALTARSTREPGVLNKIIGTLSRSGANLQDTAEPAGQTQIGPNRAPTPTSPATPIPEGAEICCKLNTEIDPKSEEDGKPFCLWQNNIKAGIESWCKPVVDISEKEMWNILKEYIGGPSIDDNERCSECYVWIPSPTATAPPSPTSTPATTPALPELTPGGEGTDHTINEGQPYSTPPPPTTNKPFEWKTPTPDLLKEIETAAKKDPELYVCLPAGILGILILFRFIRLLEKIS